MRLFKRLRSSRFVSNASWIIGGRIAQMALGVVVSALTKRYLGPSNEGLISYAASFAVFFTSICTLGFNGILVRELIAKPERQGEVLGTAIGLRLLSSLMSALAVTMLVGVMNPGDSLTVAVAACYSLGMVFQAFDVLQYWYQAKLLSKVYTIAGLVGYGGMTAFRIYLLVTKKDVIWFALASTLDYALIAGLLLLFFRRDKGPRLRFSPAQGKSLLRASYHFIISGLAVAVYGQTDKIMLRHIIDQTAVGYYATAYGLTAMWSFVLVAIIDSANPLITALHGTDHALYERRIVQLYSAILYISLFVGAAFTLLGDKIIWLLYGEAFLPSAAPLRVLCWVTPLAYLGAARDIWFVCEDKQRFSKYFTLAGAAVNVALNALLIPRLGVIGAAAATLATQLVTGFLLPLAIADTRRNSLFILRAFNPRYLLGLLRPSAQKENHHHTGGNQDV